MMKRQYSTLLLIIFSFFFSVSSIAQIRLGNEPAFDYEKAREFEIGGITVSGSENFDTQAIILYSGLTVGEKIMIPGEKISKAIKNLWDQRLFSDVSIHAAEVRDNLIYLNIELTERPRLSRFRFEGVSKGEADKLREKIQLIRGTIVNENLLSNTSNIIKRYFVDKGLLKTSVDIRQENDTIVNGGVILTIDVDKGSRIKINNIDFVGNEEISDKRLKRTFKKTKEKNLFRIFSSSKFIRAEYKADKGKLIDFYNEQGFRNAKILSDTIWDHDEKTINLRITVNEGRKFYFRDIRWIGNTKYSSSQLSAILGIERGEVYNRKKFESRLYMNPNGGDVSSLYLDDGYLAFQAIPLEVRVEADSIDTDIRIYEGRQYRINQVTISGNTKTNDRVILREIRTRPGDLFSRADIIRTQRELSQLGYFDPESFDIGTVQNDQAGTVDLEYKVAERPSDQIELSGGWGAGRIVGTLGVSFTNFSLRNVFTKGAWRPLPSGDGQRLTFRIQTNGLYYQAYSLSFTEPWLGGRKPNSLSVSIQHSLQSNGVGRNNDSRNRQSLSISGGTIGLGKRLQVPDDYFQLFGSFSYLYYNLDNFGSYFAISNGYSHNAAFSLILSRNSISEPIFPRSGSNLTLTLRATPPYSLFEGIEDYDDVSSQDRYRWTEYYKWKFTVEWYLELAPKLVAMARTGFGFLGAYNPNKGISPFERFYLGGSALSGFQLDGREIIGLRGYDDLSLSPESGSNFITKNTLELRYPISLNPSATIYGLTFLEAGNTFSSENEDVNPFLMYRSGGIGLRIFLPMFGLMGLDYGWRFDDVPNNPGMPKSQFHFTIGMNLGEL